MIIKNSSTTNKTGWACLLVSVNYM